MHPQAASTHSDFSNRTMDSAAGTTRCRQLLSRSAQLRGTVVSGTVGKHIGALLQRPVHASQCRMERSYSRRHSRATNSSMLEVRPRGLACTGPLFRSSIQAPPLARRPQLTPKCKLPPVYGLSVIGKLPLPIEPLQLHRA